MSTLPIEALQLRALEQRHQLHKTASDLRKRVKETRDRLNLSKQTRDHVIAVSWLASLIGLATGYGLAGIFVRD